MRRLFAATVAPLVAHDAQYGGELVRTVREWLACAGSLETAAGALRTQPHTVAYRIERIRGLTALDPHDAAGRERLSLGLRAHRVLAPRLPR